MAGSPTEGIKTVLYPVSDVEETKVAPATCRRGGTRRARLQSGAWFG